MGSESIERAAARPSLIVSEHPVARLQVFKRPYLTAGVTVVFSTADGVVEDLNRMINWWEAIGGRYRTMYEVDVSRHRLTVATDRTPLPARTDQLAFDAQVDISWQVAEPTVVVRERTGLAAAERAVEGHATRLMREISRQYEVADCAEVERRINMLTASGPLPVPGCGLAIVHISALVTLNRDIRDAYQRNELERLQLAEALNTAAQGEFALIASYLRHHPTESLRILQQLHQRQQELEQRQDARFASSAELFTKMLDAGLIQNIDVEDIRDQTLANILAGINGTGQRPAPALPRSTQAHLPPQLTPASDPTPSGTWADGEQTTIDVPASGVTGWRDARQGSA